MSPSNSNPGGMDRERERGGRREGEERGYMTSKSRKDLSSNPSSTSQGNEMGSMVKWGCELLYVFSVEGGYFYEAQECHSIK